MNFDGEISTPENPYVQLFDKFGIDSRSLGWSRESQRVRFERFSKLYPVSNLSLLDVGCGFSDLLFYLYLRGTIPNSYTGLETFPPFFSVSLERISKISCSNYKVFNSSWESLSSDFVHDVAVALGTFNFKAQNNYASLFDFIEFMFPARCNFLVISTLSAKAPKALLDSNPDKFFYDPDYLSIQIGQLGYSFEIIDDYLPHDIMIKITK